jgi:hypothetical protein
MGTMAMVIMGTIDTTVENPPVEVTTDFALESCEGSRETALGEIH